MKTQSVDKKLNVKLLHMTASDAYDLKSFHSITELDVVQEENEVLDELFNVKLNFALLSLTNFFLFSFRLVVLILRVLHTGFMAEGDSRSKSFKPTAIFIYYL